MAMSKKDYIEFANMFRELKADGVNFPSDILLLDTVIGKMCDILKWDNPRFDRDRFWNWIEGE